MNAPAILDAALAAVLAPLFVGVVQRTKSFVAC